MPVAILGILVKLLPNFGWWFLVGAVALVGLAIYFSGRDLAKAQSRATATNSMIAEAVKALNRYAPGTAIHRALTLVVALANIVEPFLDA